MHHYEVADSMRRFDVECHAFYHNSKRPIVKVDQKLVIYINIGQGLLHIYICKIRSEIISNISCISTEFVVSGACDPYLLQSHLARAV